jgi:membrane protein
VSAGTTTKARTRAEARRAKTWADHVQDRLPKPLREVVVRAREDDVLLFAASLGFYALVSAVPLILMVLWVATLVLGDDRIRQLATSVRQVAPPGLGADQLFQQVADLGTRIGVTAVLAGLWPATSYGAGLTRAFDRLSPRPDRGLRGLRGRGLLLLGLLPILVAGGLIGSYAGTQLLGGGSFDQALGYLLAPLTGFVGSGVGIALIYRIFPPEHIGWRNILRGTLVAATGVSLIALAITAYLDLGANFQDHYATSGMAALVLLAVFLFLSNTMMLVGYKVATES